MLTNKNSGGFNLRTNDSTTLERGDSGKVHAQEEGVLPAAAAAAAAAAGRGDAAATAAQVSAAGRGGGVVVRLAGSGEGGGVGGGQVDRTSVLRKQALEGVMGGEGTGGTPKRMSSSSVLQVELPTHTHTRWLYV